MHLLQNVARRAVVVPPETLLVDVIRLMVAHEVGAVVVSSKHGIAQGIFTERDNLVRVSDRHVDTRCTAVSTVMTPDVTTIDADKGIDDAIQMMLANRFRHLPVTNASGIVVGMVSLRYLLMLRVCEQQHSLEVLSGYAEAGGPG